MWTFRPICAQLPDRRPGVDHRPLADIGADVDEARHQHRALADERAAAHDAARHRAEAGGAERGLVPVGELQRHLVEIARRGMTDVVVQPERQQHRLLQPLVDAPAAVAVGLGDASVAARRAARAPRRPRRAPRRWWRSIRLGAIVPGGVDRRLQVGHHVVSQHVGQPAGQVGGRIIDVVARAIAASAATRCRSTMSSCRSPWPAPGCAPCRRRRSCAAGSIA